MLVAKTIPFGGGSESGLERLGGAVPPAVNILTDATGWFRRWPGMSTWSDFPTTIPNASKVIGMTTWEASGLEVLVYVTEDRQIWYRNAPGYVTALSTATVTTRLDGTLRPTFAKTKTRLVIAGGGALQEWDGGPVTSRLGGPPPNASHVAAISQRLVVPVAGTSGQFQWTDAGETNHETWPALNVAETEARPDPLVALHENSNELWAFGTKTFQTFAPDANVIWAPQTTRQVGCLAAQSIIPIPDQAAFAWLDHDGGVIITDGRSVERPAVPAVDKTIKQIATVSDCWGFRAPLHGHDLLGWVFPTDGRAFVYDRTYQRWLEVRSYASGEWQPWVAASYYYWEAKKLHLIGLASGQIVKLDMDAVTEVDGKVVKGETVSGFLDHGIKSQKQDIVMRVPLKRGVGAAGTTDPPVVELSYRDGTGGFNGPTRVSLGGAGDYSPIVEKRILGRPYHMREWKAELTATVETLMGPPEVHVEVLEAI